MKSIYTKMLETELNKFREETGIRARYEHRYGEGQAWLWLATTENNGDGMYIAVRGYSDAVNVLSAMRYGYTLRDKRPSSNQQYNSEAIKRLLGR